MNNSSQKSHLYLKVSLLLFTLRFSMPLATLAQPTNFVDELYLANSNEIVTGITHDAAGRLFFWEKSGRVWVIKNINGVPTKSPQALLDISSEIKDNWDLGFIGFALDPDFLQNGFVYACYPINPAIIGSTQATIGRLVRYTVSNPTVNFPIVNVNSKVTLFGETASTGIPILYEGHLGGALAFGTDGSLMVTAGDGSNFTTNDNGGQTYWSEAISKGIITSALNVGSNRVQALNSLNGKVMRLDPATGNGLPGNPLFDAANPRSPESRTWARGLRNPWKMIHVPNTGDHHGDPGGFIIADVGSSVYEELNVLKNAGQNFGWPHYEGMNLDWSGIRLNAYKPSTWDKPAIDYRNSFRGYINGSIVQAGSTNFPSNTNSSENASSVLVGNFNNNINFPSIYNDCFFFADYGNKRIYYTKFNSNLEPEFVYRFFNTGKFLFALDFNPVTGEIYYAAADQAYGGSSQIRKLKYSPGNRAPVAKAKADTTNGVGKLTVKFSAKNTYDPDASSTLSYAWDFGNGQTATGLEPYHTFIATNATEQIFNVTLTVTDNGGLSSQDNLSISLNNTAPIINTVTIGNNNDLIAENFAFNALLSANATDTQTPTQLTYFWEMYLGHNGHEHLIESNTGNNVTISIPALSCELGQASYWYRIHLKVTDPSGLYADVSRILYPNCGVTPQLITFPPITDKTLTQSPILLNATASSGLPITYFVTDGSATVLGSSLELTGIPNPITVRAVQHGNATFNQAKPVERTFDVTKDRTSQTVSMNTVAGQLTTASPITLTATSSLGRPVAFVVISGPATVSGPTVTFTGQPGYVTLRAYNAGDFTVDGAFTETTFYVCSNALILINPTDNLTNETKSFYANSTINSTSVITGSSRVFYKASKAIVLEPGFKVDANAVFETSFEGCPN